MTVNYATASGNATSGVDFTGTLGTITFAPGETSRTILVQTLDDALHEATETFTVNLSNPVGASDRRRPGRGHDPRQRPRRPSSTSSTTPPANRTYEYGQRRRAVENYALNSGNTAPRGAASTAAGDKVWVVDANKKVYVYNTSGGLLGSWTAGSLTPNAPVEGIATNGTDIWIVDAKQDKVFRYTGAASRLSGSQNAASSFSLNSGNTDPKDIVTDGTSLWVVNDSSTDKVFKYTLAGVAARQLDDRRRRRQPDRHHARPDQRRRPLDRRQRHRPRLPVRQRRQPHLRLASRRRRASPWPPATPTRRASPTRRWQAIRPVRYRASPYQV